MATTTTTNHTPTESAPRAGARVRVQQFGTFLSNMIMPNIGAIIGWGLITAFFIPDGWIPNEKIATMVGPSIIYLLPILIAYTGGKLVYDVRGGVVGGFSVIGVIMATSDPIFIGTDGAAPMFLGAMIMGPLGGYVIMRLDPDSLDAPNRARRPDGDFPVVWAKQYGKGRVFNVGWGHPDTTWDDPRFQQMMLEGIKWAMGVTKADVTPKPFPGTK